MFSHETIQRFKDIEAKLAVVVETHLPGDFGSWEAENSTWDGEVKTVHNAGESPNTKACVWCIFLASEMSDDILGFTNRQTNSQALNELRNGLKQAVEAIESLSLPIQIELDHTASIRLRESYDQPPEKFGSAHVTLLLVEQAMRSGIEAALSRLNEIGDEKNRKNRKAAAVVEACRYVYEARSNRPAPQSARDHTQKKDANAPQAPFTAFALDVFKVLDIIFSVEQALKLAKPFRN